MSSEKKKSTSGSVFEWDLIKRILSYTRPYKNWFIAAMALTILISLLMPVRPFIFQYILDGPVADGNSQLLFQLILLIIGLLFLQAFVGFLNTYLTNWLGQSVIKDIRIQVFKHIGRLRLSYFDRTPIGTLQTRTISDVETLNEVFSQGIINILGELLTLIAILGVMLFTSWKLTLVVLASVPILIVATAIFKAKIKNSFQRVRKYVSLMNAFLQEHISGVMVTQMFSREEMEAAKFRELNDEYKGAYVASILYYSIFFPVVEIIASLGLALLVWYGVGNILEGELTFGVLVAFIMYLNMFFRPIRMLADRINTLQLGMVSAERIFKVLDTEEKIENNGKGLLKNSKLALEKADNQQHENNFSIEMNNAWFAYKEEDWVLQDVSFRVNSGENVAIVGSTGSGKTTIISLLCRFYELQKGSVLINNQKIADLELSELRRSIGLVLQDVFLFSGSIYDNITLNNGEIPLEIVQDAAKMVGVHDFIMQLPGQYNYNVQERGATLSAGQRQLIAFARVMVHDPRILILDEATSNIDTESELLIQAAIKKVMLGRTSIIIAHRLSTIQKADRILVMNKGRICEQGTHQELLQMDGIYNKLYQLQFAGV